MPMLIMMSIACFLFQPCILGIPRVSVANIPEADIIINVDKGFILERIGTYSQKTNEAIIHTFVKLNDLCTSLSGNEMCLPTSQRMKLNYIELGTVLSTHSKHSSFSHYNRKDISRIVKREINTFLSNHKPGQFWSSVSANFHYFNENFYIFTPSSQLLSDTYERNNQQQSLTINDLKNAPIMVLEQLRSHRLGFNFLTDEEINVILLPILTSIEKTYQNASVEKLTLDFSHLIISQTVNAFRTCSIHRDDQSSPPCLIISTLFTIPSTSPIDKYITYRLHPIPVVMHQYQYTYTNLPNMIAYNHNDQNVIVFDNYLESQCFFSGIVRCSIEPIPITLLRVPCLIQMFSSNPSQNQDCDVIRDLSLNSAASNVANDVWIFDNLDQHEHCITQSIQSEKFHSTDIPGTVIEHLTCGRSIKCSSQPRVSSKCLNQTVMVFDNPSATYKKKTNFQLNLNQLAQTMLAKYKQQILDFYNEMREYEDEKSTPLKRLYKEFLNLIICILFLLLSLIITISAKYLQTKLKKQVNGVQRQINNISDIFLPDHHHI